MMVLVLVRVLRSLRLPHGAAEVALEAEVTNNNVDKIQQVCNIFIQVDEVGARDEANWAMTARRRTGACRNMISRLRTLSKLWIATNPIS